MVLQALIFYYTVVGDTAWHFTLQTFDELLFIEIYYAVYNGSIAQYLCNN